jgi:hypothetical protein
VKPPESDELQEQARGEVQIAQAQDLTMAGHLRAKLKIGRERLRQTLEDSGQLPEGSTDEAEDDMQVLARDIDMSTHNYPAAPPQPSLPAPAPAPAPAVPAATDVKPTTSKLPLLAAIALATGLPLLSAILMAPRIISAVREKPPIASPSSPQYAPILLPGKPHGSQ